MFDQFFNNLQGLWLRIRLTWRLLNDDRVPVWTKVIPMLTFAYLFSPIDVLPDVFLVLGQFDDFVVLYGGLELFERAVPEEVVEEHRQRLLDEWGIKKDTLH